MSGTRLTQGLVVLLAACALVGSHPARGATSRAALSFNRDVRPILAENCFECHGPDPGARKAGLRLDLRADALQGGKSGQPAIVPGQSAKSQVFHRLTTRDRDEAMPPAKTGKRLNPGQVSLLTRWIDEGAQYEDHWAFVKPELPAVPEVRGGKGPIDAFVLVALKKAGIQPSPEADRRTLIRRLSLDLIGLPPAPEEVEAFVRDQRPGAYERVVDRLLASPHYGERWGRHWLDLARYADSDGYEKDSPRPTAWLYRDWVIQALNRDLPFDQFTIEQLAGDLLPEATDSQRVATGFHRQTLINKEGGVDQEEFRCKANVDRAHTTGAVWLGLTVGCAECHSHKFDPITQREFYQFYAFFNNASDRDLPLPTDAEREAHRRALAKWQKREDALLAELAALSPDTAHAAPLPENASEKSEPEKSAEAARPVPAASNADTNTAAKLDKLKADLEKHRKAKPVFQPTAAQVLGAEARDTYIHVRGDFLQKGERVQPGGFAALPPLRARGENADRLDLARWLVSPENPLTARVTVNHLWRHLFARGLVATENDFGTRGERPSHPELLDWLAVTFSSATNRVTGGGRGQGAVSGLGWSQKGLIRLIVCSSTYRQISAWRADLAEGDPLNTRLARQSRFRVEAEVVRDLALAMSGLLNEKVGGPSFKPPLPADLARLNYANGLKWDAAPAEENHRRGLYIHFQRTVPFPMLMAFDAPESNTTCTRRERSNSPLQALTLWNNGTFIECAEAFGRRLAASSLEPDARLDFGFQWATGRPPTAEERTRLRQFWRGQQERFHSDAAAADTALARVLLNLDETITRE